MAIQWNTVVISIVSSLIVSLTTFVLGLRAGKNQADRQKLKDIYRNLSVHFEDILGRIENDLPKLWSSYELKHTVDGGHYLPLVKKMQKEGTILEIKPKLGNQLELCERDSLNYGYRHKELTRQITVITIELVKQYCPTAIFEKDYVVRTGQYSINL